MKPSPSIGAGPRIVSALAAASLLLLSSVHALSAPAPSVSASKEVSNAAALTAISETINRYAYAVDEQKHDMLMDTFTPDAVLVAEGRLGQPVPQMHGAKEIVDFILNGRKAQNDVRRHFVTNFWAEKIDGDMAIVHSYHLIVVTKDGKSETRATGTYRDEMVRGSDGVWRTKVKTVKLDAPY
jgi:ketosteroid isomerase-like protein